MANLLILFIYTFTINVFLQTFTLCLPTQPTKSEGGKFYTEYFSE